MASAVPSVHPDQDSFKKNKEVGVVEFKKVFDDGHSGFPFLQSNWLPVLVTHAEAPNAYKLVRKLSHKANQIFNKKPVAYYTNNEAKKMSAEEATEIYNSLNRSCFGSLYSTVDFAEDFAETVTQYFMTYKDDYEYSVKLTKQNSLTSKPRVVAHFASQLWRNSKCDSKLKVMEELFGN